MTEAERIAERTFHVSPDGHGGVTLKLRHKFTDQMATELDDDGIARTRETADENGDQENGDTPVESTLFTFGPLLPGQSAKIVDLENGTKQLVLVSPPDEVLGDTVTPNTGTVETTGDRRTQFITESYGATSEARQLSQQNANNRKYYGR